MLYFRGEHRCYVSDRYNNSTEEYYNSGSESHSQGICERTYNIQSYLNAEYEQLLIMLLNLYHQQQLKRILTIDKWALSSHALLQILQKEYYG